MKVFQRCPLVCIAALACYVAVHVFAGVLHHHGGKHRPAKVPTAETNNPQFQAASPAESEQEDSCLLCCVLHFAQIPATGFAVEAIAPLHREAASATAIIRRDALPTATYSRGPPLR
jgi:hypothetical protein